MLKVLEVTGPIYLLILAGYGAVRLGWMKPPDLHVLGRFVARFCVPALLFRAVARQPLTAVLHLDYLLVYGSASLLMFAAVTGGARWLRGLAFPQAALYGLGASLSNSAFVGYPIVQQLLGPGAGVALALCMLIENLLILPLALAAADSDDSVGGRRAALRASVRGVASNPMIVAIVLGIAVSAAGLPLPAVLDRAVALAAAAAPPTTLFVIGGTLVGLRLAGMRIDLALVTGSKLVVFPLCIWALAWLLPLHDPALRTAAVMYAAMPMLSIYPVVAQRQGLDRFAAAALLAATVVSFFTISLLVALIPAP